MKDQLKLFYIGLFLIFILQLTSHILYIDTQGFAVTSSVEFLKTPLIIIPLIYMIPYSIKVIKKVFML